MTTDAKPMQTSLLALLVVVTAASVLIAMFTAPESVLSVFAVLLVAASLTYSFLSIYGTYIRRSQTDKWRRAFRRYVILGLPTTCCTVMVTIVLYMPSAWILWIVIIEVLLCTNIAIVGREKGDQQLIRKSTLLWWARFVVLGKVTVLIAAVMEAILVMPYVVI